MFVDGVDQCEFFDDQVGVCDVEEFEVLFLFFCFGGVGGEECVCDLLDGEGDQFCGDQQEQQIVDWIVLYLFYCFVLVGVI